MRRALLRGSGARRLACRDRRLPLRQPPIEPLQARRQHADRRQSIERATGPASRSGSTATTAIGTPSIPAGSRFQAPLDTFVAGFGQRFDFQRMQIRDLRLTAKLPDGKPVELKKQFDGRAASEAPSGGKR